MKRVVVEVNKNKAIVFNSDGTFTKVRNRGYVVGQRINVENEVAGFIARYGKIAAAAVLIVFLLTGGYIFAYNTPYAYVSVDINPSIELVANIFDKVIDVKPVNDDAEEVLADIKINGSNVSDAVENIVEVAVKKGYITDENANPVLIGVASRNKGKSDVIISETEKKAKSTLKDAGKASEVITENVAIDRVKQAEKMGITPGKLNIVKKYAESTGEPDKVDIEEWAKKPVKEVINATKENRKAEKDKNQKKDPDNTDKPDRTDKPGKTERPDNTEKPLKTEKPERTERPDKTEKPEKTDRPVKIDNPEMTVRPVKNEGPEKTERPDKTEKPEMTQRPDITKKPDKTELPKKTEKPGKTEIHGKVVKPDKTDIQRKTKKTEKAK